MSRFRSGAALAALLALTNPATALDAARAAVLDIGLQRTTQGSGAASAGLNVVGILDWGCAGVEWQHQRNPSNDITRAYIGAGWQGGLTQVQRGFGEHGGSTRLRSDINAQWLFHLEDASFPDDLLLPEPDDSLWPPRLLPTLSATVDVYDGDWRRPALGIGVGLMW